MSRQAVRFGRLGMGGVLAVSLLLACKGPHDAQNRGAKKRFLSGEMGTETVTPAEQRTQAAAPIPAATAAGDPKEMERACLLDAPSAAALLRSFRLSGKSDYTMTRGRKKIRLRETFDWRQAQNGDFATVLENAQGHGLETWWAGRRFMLRRRYGKVRERPTEGLEHLRYPQDLFGAWASIYKLYRGRLQLRAAEKTSLGGRAAQRFEVSLASAPVTDLAERLPPHPERMDLGDLKILTAHRRAWRASAKPLVANGSIALDAETGVVLDVDFTGRLALPDKTEKAELTVALQWRMRDVGRPVEVKVPEAMPEPVMRKIESRRFELIDMVRIEDFLIDKWEFPNEKGAAPKVGVTVRAAKEACRSVGKRLCNFKEWQKSCHSDRPRNLYPYGRIYNAERCNTEGQAPHAVGERNECRGEFPVYDLVGNVAEWVETKKDDRKVYCLAGGAVGDKDKARCKRCIPERDVEGARALAGFRCCR